MKLRCIGNPELSHFLKREQRIFSMSYDLDLGKIFRDILKHANDFLPSEAGSIFLDDPVVEAEESSPGDLVLIACFGEMADELVGLRLRADSGIVGVVYRTGTPYSCSVPSEDPYFIHGPGVAMKFETTSVICVPLRVEDRTIGGIELLNHLGGGGYSESDLELLGIFGQTISASILNAIEAQRSREMAKRDELTGLFNDRYLHHNLSAAIAEALMIGQDLGIIFLDLDNFKTINDEHGHLVGSRVLAEVGATIHQILPGEALGARYGGDEFVIVLPGAGRQEVFWVAETVRKNIESKVFLETADPIDPVNYPELQITGVITCSLGIATLASEVTPGLPAGGLDPVAAKNELMRKADASMYRAKECGRNRTVAAWDLDQPKSGEAPAAPSP